MKMVWWTVLADKLKMEILYMKVNLWMENLKVLEDIFLPMDHIILVCGLIVICMVKENMLNLMDRLKRDYGKIIF